MQHLCDLIDPHTGNLYSFEQTRNKLNTNNFLKYYSLVSNVPKYIKDHLKKNCVNVNFEILSKKDAYLERIIHSNNVKFVDKSLDCEIIDWSKYFIILKKSCRNSYLQNFNLNCYTGSFLPIPFYIK